MEQGKENETSIERKTTRPARRTTSSEPFWQSTLPSQRYLLWTQVPSPQSKLVSGGQPAFGQSSSSELSPQSFSPSQCHRRWTQRPFAHVNSSDVHVASEKQNARTRAFFLLVAIRSAAFPAPQRESRFIINASLSLRAIFPICISNERRALDLLSARAYAGASARFSRPSKAPLAHRVIRLNR